MHPCMQYNYYVGLSHFFFYRFCFLFCLKLCQCLPILSARVYLFCPKLCQYMFTYFARKRKIVCEQKQVYRSLYCDIRDVSIS